MIVCSTIFQFLRIHTFPSRGEGECIGIVSHPPLEPFEVQIVVASALSALERDVTVEFYPEEEEIQTVFDLEGCKI